MPRRFAPRNDMQKHAGWGCIIPGTAGILPENAPATAVPEQISAYPSRQTPLHPRTRPSFCMSLRTSAHTGVAIRSPRRETWQGGGSLGEFVTPYEFAQSTAVFCALPRGYGLPRRFAPRHDMQKYAGWLHNTGRCRCTAGKRPCNRSSGANFRVPFAPNALAPAHTSFLLHVIANQCMGALQRVSLCGERSPKGALLPPWPSDGGEHGGLWGDEVWQSVLPAGKPGKVAAVWANSLRLTNSPKVLLFFAPCCGVTDCHVALLLAMTCRNMPGGCIIPGAAGILPENAPATAVPGQVFAHPSRQTPPRPLY